VREKSGFQICLVLFGDDNVKLEIVIGCKEGVVETNIDCLVCPLFLPR
jgi:hypothetical protein